MNPKENPCYRCEAPERHIGCHSSCEKHATYEVRRKEENTAIKKQKADDEYSTEKMKESYFRKVKYKTSLSHRKR